MYIPITNATATVTPNTTTPAVLYHTATTINDSATTIVTRSTTLALFDFPITKVIYTYHHATPTPIIITRPPLSQTYPLHALPPPLPTMKKMKCSCLN